MNKYTFNEWKTEGKRRFGDDFKNWKFVCPNCGRVSSGNEFIENGAAFNDMYVTCIGRHNGKGDDTKKDKKHLENGCNWAAFGLFKTMGKGDIVINDDGSETDVFAFAKVD
jgi:hypothetical protein